MSRLVDIADGIVIDLNGHSFSQAFTAAKTWNPQENLENLNSLVVRVVPVDASENAITRGTIDGVYTPQIVVIKKVANDEECDQMAELMQEISDFLLFAKRRKLASVSGATLTRIAMNPIYSVDILRQMQLWFGVIAVSYELDAGA